MSDTRKLYCLDDRSIIDLSRYYCIHDYTTYNYGNHPDGSWEDNGETNKKGTFMLVDNNHTEFVVSEDNYEKYSIDGPQADISVTDFETCNGHIMYTYLTSSKRMISLMQPMDDEEQIFSNMIKLSKYLRAFVDNIENFDDTYQESSSKNARFQE